MKIKEAARKTGLTEKTIRYYEHRGLVIPSSTELNGRRFRDYSPEDVAALEAVSTLRRVRFPVEEIGRMQQDPACIPEVIRVYGESIEETYAALGRIRELLKTGDLGTAADIYALAEKLRPAAEDIPLPKQDLHFRFRQLDRIEAEKREGVRSRPSLRGFGWIPVYSGKDKARFEEIQTSLRMAGIPFKPMSYSSAQRLTVQAMQNANTFQSRGPSINPTAKLQLDNLSREELDMFTVEVRKKDMERARTALRELK